MRLLLATAVLVTGAGAHAVAADPAASCAAIVDDQRGLVETTTGEPWRDLLSAAVGSDGRHVTVVLRLRALPATPSRPEQALVDYSMRFTVGGATAFLTAPAHASATASYGVEVGYRPLVLGQAQVTRDRQRRELRVTAPIRAFGPHADLRPGRTASNLGAHVAVTPSAPGAPAAARAQTIIVDGASSTSTYRLGDASCVTPGA